MTFSSLSGEHSFETDAHIDFLTSISLLFQRLGMRQTERTKTEDIDTDLKLKQKHEIDNPPPPPSYDAPHVIITDPQSVSEKIRQTDSIVEPKLETPTEIQDNFMNGVKTTKQVLQELNDQTIADVLSEEVMFPEIDTENDLYLSMMMMFFQKTT